MTEPRILLLDIETAPNIGYTWGKWEQNVIEFTQDWYLLAIGWKWLDEKKVHVLGLDDNKKKYTPGSPDDSFLVKKLYELFCEADVIIAHNGDQFDIKKSTTKFLAAGYQPPSPYKTVDTKKVAKRYFKFDSNKLDELGKYLGLGRKLVHTGFDLWKGCMAGNAKSWAQMKKYNKQDVLLLESVYLKLRAWHVTHPSRGVYDNAAGRCPHCAGMNVLKRGVRVVAKRVRQSLQCKDCSAAGRPAWFSGALVAAPDA